MSKANLFSVLYEVESDEEAAAAPAAAAAPKAGAAKPKAAAAAKPKADAKPAAAVAGGKPITGRPMRATEPEAAAPAPSRGDAARKHSSEHRPRREGAEPAGRAPKRQFDRHVSGTGRGKEVAKEGGGARNWGKPGDELTEQAAPASATEAGAEGAAAAEGAGAEAAEEEVDNTMTLQEYEAKVLAEKRKGEEFAPRELRRVEAVGGKPLAKEEDEVIGGDRVKSQRQRKRTAKPVADPTLFFGVPPPPVERRGPVGERGERGGRGGRGRGGFRGGEGRGEGERSEGARPEGGRGGFRGAPRGGPRGGARGGGARGGFRGGSAVPRVDDPNEFPSLA